MGCNFSSRQRAILIIHHLRCRREGEVTLRTLLESTHPRCREVLSLRLPHLRRGLLLCSVPFITLDTRVYVSSLSTHHILKESSSPFVRGLSFSPHLHSLMLHSDSMVCDSHLNPISFSQKSL